MEVKARGPKPEAPQMTRTKKVGTAVAGAALGVGLLGTGHLLANRAVDNITSTDHISDKQKAAAERGLEGQNELPANPSDLVVEVPASTAASPDVDYSKALPPVEPAIPTPPVNPTEQGS